MKLIPWKFNNDMVEGYTVPAHIDGITAWMTSRC